MKSRSINNIRHSEVLDWILLAADADALEALLAAREGMLWSARGPRELLARALGWARVERIIEAAIDLGRALLFEAEKPDWWVFERKLLPLARARADAAIVGKLYAADGGGPLAALAAAKAPSRELLRKAALQCFQFALSLQGAGGPADFCIGAAKTAAGKYLLAEKEWRRLAASALAPRWRAMAQIQLLLSQIYGGRYADALAPAAAPLVVTDRDLARFMTHNRLLLAVRLNDSVAVRRLAKAAGENLNDAACLPIEKSQFRALVDSARSARDTKPSIMGALERAGGA